MHTFLCVREPTDGRTNAEIAHELRIRERSVKGHLTDLFTKLEADTRMQAAVAALRRAIVD